MMTQEEIAESRRYFHPLNKEIFNQKKIKEKRYLEIQIFYDLRELGFEWLKFDLRFKNYEDAYQDFKYYLFEIYPSFEVIYDDEDWEEGRLYIMDGIDEVLDQKYGCLRN